MVLDATDKFLTPLEVSKRLSVPASTLARWRHLRKGPRFHKFGRHVRYRTDDLTAWFEANRAS